MAHPYLLALVATEFVLVGLFVYAARRRADHRSAAEALERAEALVASALESGREAQRRGLSLAQRHVLLGQAREALGQAAALLQGVPVQVEGRKRGRRR